MSIAGLTRKGQGLKTTTRESRTAEDYPDKAVTDLRATMVSHDTLEISFTEYGSFAYGTIKNYYVFYKKNQPPSLADKFKKIPATAVNGTVTYKLKGLDAYTRYGVRVEARSGASWVSRIL